MSGSLYVDPGVLTRGEGPEATYAYYSSPYLPLVRGLDRRLGKYPPYNGDHPYYEPGFSLLGADLKSVTMGAQGGLKFDLLLAACVPAGQPSLLVGSRDFTECDRPVSSFNNRFFRGRIIGLKIGKTCINALSAGGVVGISLSELTLANDDHLYDSMVAEQTYVNQNITIYGLRYHQTHQWLNGTPFAHPIFSGVITGISRAGRRVTLTLGDAVNFGPKDLVPESQKFDGATNNGGEALKDQPKPVCVGDVFNVSPVYLGQADLGAGTLPTFQVNYTSVNDVTAVRVRGALMTKITSGTPAVGQFRSFNSTGKFQTGSTPSGALTCDVQGHSAGSYGYSNTLAGVLRKLIVDVTGAVTSAKTPNENFANVLSLTAEAGFYWGPQKATLIDALNTVCGGTLTVVHGQRDGTIGAFFLDVPTPAVFSITDADVIQANELPMPDDFMPRPDEIEMGYEYNHTRLSDIAETVTGDVRTWLGEDAKKLTLATSLKGTLAKPKKLKLTSLLKNVTSAENRVNLLKDFVERAPRMIQVSTPYYLGQVELGMTANVSLTQLGVQGRQMVVAEFQEDFITGRLQLILIG